MGGKTPMGALPTKKGATTTTTTPITTPPIMQPLTPSQPMTFTGMGGMQPMMSTQPMMGQPMINTQPMMSQPIMNTQMGFNMQGGMGYGMGMQGMGRGVPVQQNTFGNQPVFTTQPTGRGQSTGWI
jgi:hypothetical protein